MKILVTGGAGFIGSHIVDAYVTAGHKVVVVDNLSNGSKKYVAKKTIFYKVDITDAAKLEKIFEKERPEAVSHHAALISVADSVRDPEAAYAVNVMGTANVLVAFGKYGSGHNKKFIFPSSAAVYGNPQRVPLKETDPLLPLSPYGISKVIGEDLAAFHAEQFGFAYTIFRYANIYGPRQNTETGGVVAKVEAVLKRRGRPLQYGDGTNTRDYIYVGDIARANVLALKKANGATLNLASGKATTDATVLALICAAMGVNAKPLIRPFRPGEIHHSTLQGALAKKVLGWTPKTAFKAGVLKTVRG